MNHFDHFHHDLGEIRRRVMDGTLKAYDTVSFPAGTLSEVYVEQTEMIAIRDLSKRSVSETIKKLEELYSQMNPAPISSIGGNS